MRDTILLVEDDAHFGFVLSRYLHMHEFEAYWVKTGGEAMELIQNQSFRLAILDIMLPDLDGYQLAREWRYHHPQAPFLFLSAKSLKIDQLEGYRIGCADYVTKPIDEEVFIAKIKAILQTAELPVAGHYSPELSLGRYRFDPEQRMLHFEDSTHLLTERESRILYMLYEHRNKLLPRKVVLQQLWGQADFFSRKSMDVFIFRLRKYLEKDPEIEIKNVHGRGFILSLPVWLIIRFVEGK